MRASPRASSNPDPNPEGVPGRPTTPGTPSAPLPSLQGPPRHSPLSGALRAFQAHIKPSSSPLLDLSLTTELRPPSQASASDIKNRPRHPVPKSELRKGTTPKTNRESAPGLYGRREVLSAGKDAQPEPKADTRAHGERRYPRDFETLRAARFGFAIVGNDIKNPPWLPTTNHEPIRRTEKRHHSQTNRESAPTPLRTSRPCPQRRRTRSPSPRPTRAHTGH